MEEIYKNHFKMAANNDKNKKWKQMFCDNIPSWILFSSSLIQHHSNSSPPISDTVEHSALSGINDQTIYTQTCLAFWSLYLNFHSIKNIQQFHTYMAQIWSNWPFVLKPLPIHSIIIKNTSMHAMWLFLQSHTFTIILVNKLLSHE